VMIFLLFVRSPAQAYLYAALLGTAIGTGLTLNPVVFADYYGREALGAIRGVAEPFISFGQAAGVLMAGVVYDQTGTYTAAILAFAGLAALSALLIAGSRPPRKGEE
jgi:predicted MFS family arabinose efflux permease